MKRLILLLLLLPSLAWGQIAGSGISLSGAGAGASVAATTQFPCTNSTTDGKGNAVLLCEDFQGDQDCGDASHTNCRSEWTEGTFGTLDYNYTTGPLDGTQSVYIIKTAGVDSLVHTFTAAGTVYARVMVSAATLGVSANNRTLEIGAVSGDVMACAAEVKDCTGTDRWVAGNGNGSAACVGTEQTVAENTPYYLWLKYVKGASAGTCQVWASTTSSKPETVTSELTSQTINVDADRVRLFVWGGIIDGVKYDNLAVDSDSVD